MQKIMYLGLVIKKLPYFEVFDLQWPQMTLEVKILKSQMLVDTIRVYMQKNASQSVFIMVQPQLAIFDLCVLPSGDLLWPQRSNKQAEHTCYGYTSPAKNTVPKLTSL